MIKLIITNIQELRKPCEEVKEGENINDIVQDLKDTLIATKHGLGLTANQIGYNKKISYIRNPKQQGKEIVYDELIMLNAKIIDKQEPIKFWESCLSFKGIGVYTKRYSIITVEFENEARKKITSLYTGLLSVIIQHEYSHLLGKTMFDYKWKAR
jgi:peptide deformylase